MFITNSNSFKKTKLYRCDKDMSMFLQKNGFSLFSIENNDYIFVLTDDLKQFLKKKGGGVSGKTSSF